MRVKGNGDKAVLLLLLSKNGRPERKRRLCRSVPQKGHTREIFYKEDHVVHKYFILFLSTCNLHWGLAARENGNSA